MDQHSNPSPSFINIAVLLLFAVVIAVTSAVTTYFISNSRTNEQYSGTQPSVIPPLQTNVLPTIIPTTTTASDETANWKVYRYDKYGFQISYPPDWTFDINPYTEFEPGTLWFSSSPKVAQNNSLFFHIQRYDLQDKGFGYPVETTTSPNTVIDGVKAYKDIGYVRNPDGPSTQTIWLIRNNFVYALTFNVYKNYNLPSQYKYEDIKPAIFTPEEEKMRDAFISTFKFIE